MFSQFFVLFGLIGVGFFCSKRKYLNNEMTLGLGNLVLFVTIPIMLFNNLATTTVEKDMLMNFAVTAVLEFFAILIFGRLVRLYFRFRHFKEEHLNMLEVTAASVNNGFIGVPIVMLFFNNEAIVYMSASVLALNLYIWSIGLYIIKGSKGDSLGNTLLTLVKGALNPNITFILLGFIASVTGVIAFFPDFVMELISTVGGISTPLSLIYIGALTGNGGIRMLFRDSETLEASVVKMIAMPLMAFLIALFLPLDPMVKTVFLIGMTTPAAAVVPMVVGRYGIGVDTSSKMVLATTAISVVTLPLAVYIVNLVWL